MKIIEIDIDKIKPYTNNPRINENAVEKVAESIKQFGFKQPVVLDKNNIVVAGHTRLKASKKLNLKKIPCFYADDLTDEQIKAYRLADNKTGEFADWDIEKLNIELEELNNLDLSFDMSDFGFEEIEEDKKVEEDDFNADEAIESITEPVTKRGYIYKLGNHRLMCGDSTNKNDVELLIDNNKIDSLITDPPYGVDYSSKNEFLNKMDKGNRVQKEIKNDNIKDYKEFFKSFLELIPFSDYNTFYITMLGQELHNLRLAIEECKYKWCDYLIWVKNNHVLGRKDYNAKHEFIVYGWKDKHKFYGDFSTTVFEYNKPLKNDLHPTMKPIELICKLINDGSLEGMNIYDGFGGSGSTLIACEQLKRNCFMMELDEKYCDVIVKRWEDYTGKKSKLINEKNSHN